MKTLISRRAVGRRLADSSISTVKRLEKDDPDFPKRVVVTPGRIGFYEDEVDAWISARERVG